MNKHRNEVHLDIINKLKDEIKIKKGEKQTFQLPHLNEIHGNQVHISHNPNPEYCVECDKTFFSSKTFNAHLQNAHGLEKECKECGVKLQGKHLHRHMRYVHVKDKKFLCNECPKKFIFNDDLKKHIERVHRNLRPYGCEKCSYRASSVYNLNVHRKKMHQATDYMSRVKLIELIENGNHPFCESEFIMLLKNSAVH